MRPVRVGVVVATAVAAGTFAAPAAARECPTPGPSHTADTLIAQLEIETSFGWPVVRGYVERILPPTAVEGLRSSEPDEPGFRQALAAAFPKLAVHRPRLRIEDGRAHVTAELGELLFTDRRGTFPLGPWELKAADDARDLDLTFSWNTGGPDTTVLASICVDGLDVRRASPLPAFDDGDGGLGWRLTPDDGIATIDVRLRPSFATRAQLGIQGGPFRYATRAAPYLPPIFVLLLVAATAFATIVAARRRRRVLAAAFAGAAVGAIPLALLAPWRHGLPTGGLSRWHVVLAVAVGAVGAVVAAAHAAGVRRAPSAGGRPLALTLTWALLSMLVLAGTVVGVALDGFPIDPEPKHRPAFALAACTVFFVAASRDAGKRVRYGVAASILSAVVLYAATIADAEDWSFATTVRIVRLPLLLVVGWAMTSLVALGLVNWIRAFAARSDPHGRREALPSRLATRWLDAAVVVLAALWLAQGLVALERDPALDVYSTIRSSFDTWTLPCRQGCDYALIQGRLLYQPIGLVRPLSAFFPLVALAALAAVLMRLARRSDGDSAVVPDGRATVALVLLFAAFVVGPHGWFLGFWIPVSFVVAATLLALVCFRGRPAGPTGRPGPPIPMTQALKRQQRQLLRHAVVRASLEARTKQTHADYAGGKLTADEYAQARGTAGRERAALARNAERAPAWAERFGLTLGPCGTWWENGMLGLRLAAPLAAVPIAFFVGGSLVREADAFFSASSQIGLIRLVDLVADELIFWSAAAFAFGALYTRLWGANGAWKGLTLALVYIVAQIAANAIVRLVADTDLSWWLRAGFLLLFLPALGVRLDRATLRHADLPQEHLPTLYRLRTVRGVVAYASPAIVALITIGQQLASGALGDALRELVSRAPSFVPPT